jgi:predicted peroxiredoxin
MTATESLLVVVTTGLEDGGRRAAFAVGVALAALAEGKMAHLFLSLESAPLATPEGARGIHPRGFSEPLSGYLDHFVDLGGQLEVCSSCFDEYCKDSRRDETGNVILRPGTRVESLGTVARRAGHMPVLTF